MDADDLELFRRSLAGAVASATGTALDSALAELGWTDALADDPRAAVSTLFELQGGATATSSALDLVLADALDLEQDDDVGAGVGAEVGVVLPAMGRWDPPGSLVGGELIVDGLAGAAAADQPTITVLTAGADGPVAVAVPTSALAFTTIEGVDPDLGLQRVAGSVAGATGVAVAPERWTAAVARARLALGHELVGTSRRMLELAREHALERVQFGVPISSFQAIRHRLAETLVAIEMAEAVLDAAWISGDPDTAAMAKAVAGRSARTTMRHCQQTLAGIGFTNEHDLHRSIRRTLVLDGLLGTATTLTRNLGDELVETRTLPPLLPL